jgi:type IV pilus assembly protein PilM
MEDGQVEMSVLLVAAKKEKINELTEVIRAAGLTPKIIDVDAFAIENMYGINYEPNSDDLVALVNIGGSVMNINILKGNTSLFTRDISVGGSGYSEAIQREMGVSFDEAESLKKGQSAESDTELVYTILEGVNAEVASEIAKSIDYFKTTSSENELTKMLLCGGCAKVYGLERQLSERMHLPVEIANPFRKLDLAASEFTGESLMELAPLAGVGVGLAIRAIGDR